MAAVTRTGATLAWCWLQRCRLVGACLTGQRTEAKLHAVSVHAPCGNGVVFGAERMVSTGAPKSKFVRTNTTFQPSGVVSDALHTRAYVGVGYAGNEQPPAVVEP